VKLLVGTGQAPRSCYAQIAQMAASSSFYPSSRRLTPT